MSAPSTETRRVRRFLAGTAIVITFVLAACGGSSDSSLDATTTTKATTTEAPTTTEATTTTEAATTTTADEPGPGGDLPGGTMKLGDKTILLDGFIGMKIPDGWSVSKAAVPLTSTTAGDETELDTKALKQVLVVGPTAEPRAASFALVHYTHSDKVPTFDLFSTSIRKALSADGSAIGEPKSARIGGQEAALHQLKSARGTNGLLVTLQAGDEYFFILSLVTDQSYGKDAANLLSSVSMQPALLHG